MVRTEQMNFMLKLLENMLVESKRGEYTNKMENLMLK